MLLHPIHLEVLDVKVVAFQSFNFRTHLIKANSSVTNLMCLECYLSESIFRIATKTTFSTCFSVKAVVTWKSL
jgi:hypothetical protein